MRGFDEIFAIAAERKGGPEALNALIDKPKPVAELSVITEDRWLAVLTKCVFQAGFNWQIIEAKWEGFEAAFDGFDVGRCAFMDDIKFDALLGNKEIVRNAAKIASVRENAAFLMQLREKGGAGHVFGTWPSHDYISLLGLLKTDGARLGGATAMYAMRFMRRDGFILSGDVTARLMVEGVIDKPAGSKTSMRAVQSAFNEWMNQSGRSLSEISLVLAMSVE